MQMLNAIDEIANEVYPLLNQIEQICYDNLALSSLISHSSVNKRNQNWLKFLISLRKLLKLLIHFLPLMQK